MKNMLAFGLDDLDVIAEIFETAAAGINDVELLILTWDHQI